jgi:hypothetical protein
MVRIKLIFGLVALLLIIYSIEGACAKNYENVNIASDSVTFMVIDRDAIGHTISVQFKDVIKVAAKLDKGNSKKFDGIAQDVNSEYELSDAFIKERIILLTNKAKTSFDFEIVKSGGLIIEQYGNTIQFKSVDGGYVVITCPEPYAIDALGHKYRYRYKLAGNKIKLEPAESLSGMVYPLTIDPSYLVNADGIDSSTYAHRNLARSTTGEFYMAYILNTGGNDTATISHSETGTTWNIVKQFTGLYGDAAHVSMAIDRYDHLHVVWSQDYNATWTDIYYSYYNGSGWSTPNRTSWTMPDPYFEAEWFYATYPAIAVDENCYAHITYYSHWDYQGFIYAYGVAYAKYYNGVFQIDYFLTGGPSTSDPEPTTTAICVDDYNNLHVAFSLRQSNVTDKYRIFYRKSVDGGASWSDSELLTDNDYNATQPSIAVDNKNNPLIAYGTYGNWTSRKIRLLEYNGTDWNAPINISGDSSWGWTCDDYWQGAPSIAPVLTYSGVYPSDLFIVWYGSDSLSPDVFQLYYRWRYINSWYNTNQHIGILNATYPCAIWATWPEKCNTKTDVAKTGFMISYTFNNDSIYSYEWYGDGWNKLTWEPFSGYSLTVLAKNIKTGDSIMNFTASLDTGSSNSTTTGSVLFDCEDADQWITITVASTGYYITTDNVYLDNDKTVTVRLSSITEDIYVEPKGHLVEWRVITVYGKPLSNINVTATPVETTLSYLDWLRSIFLFDENTAEQMVNASMSGHTDSNGAITFMMLEVQKYKMTFVNITQGVNETYYYYPKDSNYVITVGEMPAQKIGYWVTTQQNNETNTGNITAHYVDYSIPVKTNWVNFSIYYLKNGTLAYSHNFTSPSTVNENTSINLNASYAYKVILTASHDDLGIVTTSTIIIFVIPEYKKFPLADLEDWQISLFGGFLLIVLGLIFGYVSSGTGGIIWSFSALGIYYFGWLPLISKAVAAVIFPLLILLSIVNKLGEHSRVVPA